MALTPVDILHTRFGRAIKGYNRGQVDEFVRAVLDTLNEALREKSELLRRIDELQEEVARVRSIESTMTNALTLAQKTADEVKANAHRHAEMIIAEAEQARVRMTVEAQKEVEKHRTELEMLGSARDRFEAEFRGVLRGYLEWLERRDSEQREQAEVA